MIIIHVNKSFNNTSLNNELYIKLDFSYLLCSIICSLSLSLSCFTADFFRIKKIKRKTPGSEVKSRFVRSAAFVRVGGLITYERSGETESIYRRRQQRRRRPVEARSLSFFEFRSRSTRPHLEEISSVLGRAVPWKRARRQAEPHPVNPFAILSISLTAIKVMSYEIDCPHKIVSSPFCGGGIAREAPSSEARNKWPPPLYSAQHYRSVDIVKCN